MGDQEEVHGPLSMDMSDTGPVARVTDLRRRAFVSGLLALGAVALAASAHAADDPVAPAPAAPYVPPAQKQLTPQDIVITRGPEPRQLTFSTKQGSPLALLLVTTSDDGRVRISSPGTDFTQPSTWRQLGFGDLCWRTTPPSAEAFVLPEPTLPFSGPPGTWQYSNVIVSTAQGPVVYNKPLPNQYVTGQGSAMESLIACVVPAGGSVDREALRADDAENDAKVTICHATASEDSPYVLMTISVNSVANSGHLEHTGPLYPQVGWGDVIPPIEGVTPGLNWPAGQGLLENGCVPVAPPIDPWPPIEPPEVPVEPENPIIVVPPPIVPIEPPIATVSPSPTSTEPGTIDPSPPIATVTPSPTDGATETPTATPSGTPETSGTPGVTPSSTPTPSGTPESSGTPATSETPANSPSPSATLTDRDLRDSLDKYCETGDEQILPAGVRDSRTTAYLTNGVSTLRLDRAYSTLYCKARALPATVPEETDDVLADTGSNPSIPFVAGLVLLAAAIVLTPIKRHR